MTVNILGVPYEIIIGSEDDYPQLENCTGYTETLSKKIVVQSVEGLVGDPRCLQRIDIFQKSTIRHEIIHAFLYESGLDGNSEWATNEEIVDWIALQSPKMTKAFTDAGADTAINNG